MTKSSFYYNKKNVHLDKIVFKVENDAAAAAAALKAGRPAGHRPARLDAAAGIRADKGCEIQKQTGLGYQGITLNLGNRTDC